MADHHLVMELHQAVVALEVLGQATSKTSLVIFSATLSIFLDSLVAVVALAVAQIYAMSLS